MSLELDIKQTKPFNSEGEKCMVNIIYTNNLIQIFQNKIIKKHDISIEQYNVLRILQGQKGAPLTINNIIERMLDKMSNASRLVDKLYQKGLVNRTINDFNRRSCDVSITEDGVKLVHTITQEFNERFESVFSMPNEEMIQLNHLLDTFRDEITFVK